MEQPKKNGRKVSAKVPRNEQQELFEAEIEEWIAGEMSNTRIYESARRFTSNTDMMTGSVVRDVQYALGMPNEGVWPVNGTYAAVAQAICKLLKDDES